MRRSVLWCLPVAGVLYLIGVIVRGSFVVPSADKASDFVTWASTSTYPMSYALVSAAAILAIIGYTALDDLFASALGRAAMMLSIAGAGFLLALFGILWFGFPAIAQAGPGAITQAVNAYNASMPVQILASLNIIGHILFAIAMWRRAGLLRVAALPFAAAPILQAFVFAYPAELAGQVLFALAGIAIVWKQTGTAPAAAVA